jgi:hypothetical protein
MLNIAEKEWQLETMRNIAESEIFGGVAATPLKYTSFCFKEKKITYDPHTLHYIVNTLQGKS